MGDLGILSFFLDGEGLLFGFFWGGGEEDQIIVTLFFSLKFFFLRRSEKSDDANENRPQVISGCLDAPLCMLQMVRTQAQFSIALKEMNGEKGDGGERDAGGEERMDRTDALDHFRNNNRNLNGHCAARPHSNREVHSPFSSCAI